MRVLVTGGAGFVGHRLVQQLAERGFSVIVLDNLSPQVHGDGAVFEHVDGDVQQVKGDIRDRQLVDGLVREGLDIVYHLAAMTGVGQSMYQIENYVDINSRATAVLLEAIAAARVRPKKIVLASSRAVYGEGRAHCDSCGTDFYPIRRVEERLARHEWEHRCPTCNAPGRPAETAESAPTQPTSVYGITKLEQENLCRIVGEAYQIPVTILRYFNVYGPGQSPRNPYTGILSIFSRRLMTGLGIEIYEDGRQLRDFVYVDDVIQANLLAGIEPVVGTFNICSGEAVSVLAVARVLCELMGIPEDVLTVTGRYRVGDIRHCFASWKLAQKYLGYQPRVPLRTGLERLVGWLRGQNMSQHGDTADQTAQEELSTRGLFK